MEFIFWDSTSKASAFKTRDFVPADENCFLTSCQCSLAAIEHAGSKT